VDISTRKKLIRTMPPNTDRPINRAMVVGCAVSATRNHGDRCIQGGGEGHEAQLALVEAPEIRQKLHHKDGCPSRSQRRHLANPQGGEYEGSPAAATRGMGM
jgi:hypothetical protein